MERTVFIFKGTGVIEAVGWRKLHHEEFNVCTPSVTDRKISSWNTHDGLRNTYRNIIIGKKTKGSR